jgi:hypothetical protein
MNDAETAGSAPPLTDGTVLDLLASLSGLSIRPEDRAGVLAQWRLNQELAAPLLAFDLPDDTPPAPVFRP